MFGSYDGKVYAVDASRGTLRWSYQTGDKVVSSPALAHDTLYVGSYDHMVYAFGPAVETQPPTASMAYMDLAGHHSHRYFGYVGGYSSA